MGMVTPARAGQMVIVSHVHGDPDRPYVSGFVVDKYNMPPWELPRNSALSGLRSQSLGESFASNHLALDDTHGALQAQLASDHGKSSLSLGFNTRIDGNKGRQDARGEGFELRTDKWGVLRAALGLFLTTEARPGAQAHAKDMSETVARLTQARDIHESIAELAQQHAAQGATGNQSEVAKSIKAANDEIRGSGKAKPNTNDFPEFAAPHLTLASPAGIQTTTAGSTHVASDQDFAVTSGRYVSFAAARSLFASVLETFAVFAQKAGIRLTAAAGKIRIEAQSDSAHLIAKQDVELVSIDGWINLTATKGVRINGGGTVVEISPRGLVGLTNGRFLVHAASHATEAPQDKPVKMPLTEIAEAKVAERFMLVDNRSGLLIPNQPYRITLADGHFIRGVTDHAGEMSPVLAGGIQPATVEILHNDGSDNPAAIFVAMLTRPADASEPPRIVSEKRSTSRVGERELQRNSLPRDNVDWYTALCQPYNWGIRYSVKDEKDAKRLDFPIAKEYALDLADVLIEKVKWESGHFALPVNAVPVVVVSDKESGAQGEFSAQTWALTIYAAALQKLFDYDPTDERTQRDTDARMRLRDFADTIFHETRHCQQYFWIYAMAQQQVENFKHAKH